MWFVSYFLLIRGRGERIFPGAYVIVEGNHGKERRLISSKPSGVGKGGKADRLASPQYVSVYTSVWVFNDERHTRMGR